LKKAQLNKPTYKKDKNKATKSPHTSKAKEKRIKTVPPKPKTPSNLKQRSHWIQ
jgi:hypothetical protein